MKKLQWFALLMVAAVGGCGSDDSVSPSPDVASAWVGEFAGTGSYALSNGQSGTGQPTTLLIEAATPKQIMVSANLVYGTGRNEAASAFAIVTPAEADQIETQYRQGTSRIVLLLTRDGDAISGSIITSTLRIGGNWTEDQRMTIEVTQ